MKIKHRGIKIDLSDATSGTCIMIKQDGSPCIWVDTNEFTDFPKEDLDKFIKSIVDQVIDQY